MMPLLLKAKVKKKLLGRRSANASIIKMCICSVPEKIGFNFYRRTRAVLNKKQQQQQTKQTTTENNKQTKQMGTTRIQKGELNSQICCERT